MLFLFLTKITLLGKVGLKDQKFLFKVKQIRANLI